VDFGFAGLIPRAPGEAPAKTWVFVMTLSHSRHQYVELVQDQTVGTWLALHRNAFQFFGGVPRKIVLDNLKGRDPSDDRWVCVLNMVSDGVHVTVVKPARQWKLVLSCDSGWVGQIV